MRIYTRTGDDGTTGLFGGSRIGKDDLRIEAYGTLDELNAVLGRVGTHPSVAPWSAHLTRIQGDLFAMGSHLATTDPAFAEKLPALDPDGDAKLEAWMDEMEASLPALTTFVLPSGPASAVDAHVARTVCRRAERRCVALNRAGTHRPFDVAAIEQTVRRAVHAGTMAGPRGRRRRRALVALGLDSH